MKIKFTLKTITAFVSLGIIILIAAILFGISVATYKPTAAFYGIEEKTQKEIEALLQTTHQRKNKKSLPYKIVILDDTYSLEQAIKKSGKPELLFIHNGINAEYAQKLCAKKHAYLENSILSGMTNSIKNATPVLKEKNSNSSKITAVPLLIDHYEIDVNKVKLSSSSVQQITIFENLENFAKITKSSTTAPIIFAGADDRILIDVFAAVAETIDGSESLTKAKEQILKNIKTGTVNRNNFYDVLTELSYQDAPLYKTFQIFQQWKKQELLPRNILQLQQKDVTAYLSGNLCAVSFLTLSKHRTIPYEIISKYESSFVPSISEESQRNLIAPLVMGIPLKKDKIVKNSLVQLATNLQSQLCSHTGLAPVQAQCSTPDIQSDDVRFWVAALGTPLPSFSDSCFTTKHLQSNFAEALRSFLGSL